MEGFLPSLIPFFRKYALETVFLTLALLCTALSFVFFLPRTTSQPVPQPALGETAPSPAQVLYVDVSGSVANPDVYKLKAGARLKDAIRQAGGLTDEADKAFFGRNYNLARLLSDQEKIFVPSLYDTGNGTVLENKRVLDYTQPQVAVATTELQTRISVNSATPEELDSLPSVGAKTAQLIIQNRPYTALDELVRKKALDQKTYDSLLSLISL